MHLQLIVLNIFIQTSLASYATLRPNEVEVVNKPLYVPRLNELAKVLNNGMTNDYSYVDVKVVCSPDFRKAPYNLVSKGISGDPVIMEVGGPGYLLPFANLTRIYDLGDMMRFTGRKKGDLFGATAGPYPYVGVNSEEIVNIRINGDEIVQKSRIYKVNRSNGSPVEQFLPNNETRFAIMGHLYISEGRPGRVLQVHVKRRKSDNDLIGSIRTVLADHYGSNIIGMGGVFWTMDGILNQHIMPNFSRVALNNDDELNQWLYFYNMTAPLIGVGTLVTGNYSLDLRLQHFHTYSNHKEGGHYHVDVTPDTIEYLGYFMPASKVYRVDRPPVHRGFGRDRK